MAGRQLVHVRSSLASFFVIRWVTYGVILGSAKEIKELNTVYQRPYQVQAETYLITPLAFRRICFPSGSAWM
jgi:hypothetical protein